MSEQELVGMLVGAAIGLVCGVVINAILCIFISGWLKEVPEQYRTMSPGQVWLLCIPIFSLYWMFRVYMIDFPQSFKNYFNATGNTGVGDCGKSLGLWVCILTLVGLIPIVNYCSGIATLILWILWLVKIHGLKQQIVQARNQPAPMA